MFQWLFSLFSKTNSNDVFCTYKPEERLIYSYWNGKELIKADPMTLYKKVMSHGAEISIDWKVSSSVSKDAISSHSNLIKRLREIFEIPPFQSDGLTESELIDLLDHFLSFVNIVKKNSSISATLPNSMELSLTSSETESPTTNSSDCGSTEKEDSTEKQQ